MADSIQIELKPETYWAEQLNVCSATLARARKRGEIAFVRIGDRVLYSPEHIAQWIRSRTVTPKKAA